MKEQKLPSIRQIALLVLMESFENNRKLNEVLMEQQMIYQYLPKQDRAFLNRLCRGCVERTGQIDYVINSVSKTKVKKMKPVIRTIIRMGAYQILFMEVPDSAACNEAVKLAKGKGFHGLTGFVNGVLRNIARSKHEISYPGKKDFLYYLESVYSIPEWLGRFFVSMYGEELTEQTAEAFLEEMPTTIGVCESKISVEAYKKMLEEAKIAVSAGDYVPSALKLSEYDYIQKLPGYEEGFFRVQDESSMLPVVVAAKFAPQAEKILDVCAAPGGKTLFLAELLPKAKIEARDVSEFKVEKLEENIERSGCFNVTTKIWDATVKDESITGLPKEERYDVVMADLPCSGLGVIGKKCDIKYHMSEAAVRELENLQKKILSVITEYLKPGGILVYSTCTMNQGENQKQVKWLLEKEPELAPLKLSRVLPETLWSHLESWHGEECRKAADGNMLQLYPGIHKTDGFFVAAFRKNEE